MGISDENKEILEDLSKEKKKKPKKEKKSKKAKDSSDEEEDDDLEDNSKQDKKKRKKQEKKDKKEKSKENNREEKLTKKLPRKRVISIFALCFSILAFILIMLSVIPGITNKKQARWAFENADYQSCYSNLYGMERNQEEEIIYRKSEIILLVQRQLDSYKNLKELGENVRALDALFEGIRVFRMVEAEAEELAILERISPIQEEICLEMGKYELTEKEIEEIINYESKVAYTKRLESIVNGTTFEWQGLEEE